jgi:hypothetical protein
MASGKPEDDFRLEEALARVRAGEQIDADAKAMVGSTNARAALEDLRADLPLDATGPFVRKVAHLATERVGPESERREGDVIAIPAQPMAELPRAKVMIQPQAVNPHVTAPSIAKRAALGLPVVSEQGTLTAGGRTMRLGTAAPSVGPDSQPQARRSRWSLGLWTGVIVALAGSVPLLVHRVAGDSGNDARPAMPGPSEPARAAAAPTMSSAQLGPEAPSGAPIASSTAVTDRPAPSASPTTSARRPPASARPSDVSSANPPAAETSRPSATPNTTASTKPWLQ